jgi:hypothetical protein
MRAVTHVGVRGIDQPEVRFVHERRRIQGAAGLAVPVVVREPAHSLIHKRHKLIECIGVPGAPAVEQIRELRQYYGHGGQKRDRRIGTFCMQT